MTTATKTKLLDGLLIDPFRKEVRRIRVGDELATWYKLLECDNVDRCPIASDSGNYHVLHGYGLVLACDRQGNTISLSSSSFKRPVARQSDRAGLRTMGRATQRLRLP